MMTRQHMPTLVLALTIVGVALTGAPALAQQGLSDADITSAVTEELFEDTAVQGYTVQVETDEGVVTLSGTTSNLLSKRRAERLAEAVRGVRSVVNSINITAPTRSDAEIQADIREALAYNRATESFEIDVAVTGQEVTLTGAADSWQEKQIAAKVAMGVRGVKDIDNNITITYEDVRTDTEIVAEVDEALRWNVLVDDALIDVAVDDGEVTLTGTVGSAAEKREARYDAWVAGVTAVDAAGLQVARWARDPDLRGDKFVDLTDEQIEYAIERSMLYDPRVNAVNVTAEVNAGVVTLAGAVDSVMARRAAADDARNTVGVWRVKNMIRVKADAISDAQIEKRIVASLRRDPVVDRYDVTVSVVDGAAYLTGTVDNSYEKATAEDLAASTYGVTALHNNLIIADEFAGIGYDPYVDDAYLYDYDWYTYSGPTTTASDWEIRDNIQAELWWSPFVNSDEVTVTVDDGVATLNGTVDTWSERRAATENAYEGGAVTVDNNLSVNYGPDYYAR